MEIVFLLGGRVFFWPERNFLVLASDQSKRISLSNPASRCLSLLIQAHGAVVERDYFFQQVWLNNGAQVSNNTFYQNISLLRRAFKDLGLNEEWIVTIPKVGIKLDAALEVSAQEMAIHPEAESVLETPEPVPATTLVRQTDRRRQHLAWAIGAFLLCLLAGSLTWISEFDTRLLSYIPLESQQECHFFANADALDFEKHQYFVDNTRFECRLYPWVYLTMYPNFARISALTCRQQYSRWHENQCVTHYYFREEKNVGV
ncbi:winged helix-turn-helix domain-containing protein [Yokenella regensburgei]|uniref:winged helix-turn-helix domain-containing protein n=1 Tax=Yokenella regensburgei TaxID=158877 RepID=UPI0014328F37|nr:winged helix-turn-helix domain-containing protein [Yokenella regensburgei]QIU89619.1 CadC family transcriptional regulator [Yokenella regensburgei]